MRATSVAGSPTGRTMPKVAKKGERRKKKITSHFEYIAYMNE